MGSLLGKGFTDVGNVLYRAAPLVMVGLAVAFAYQVGLFNIGASGQYTIGAFLALTCAIELQMPWYVCLLAAFCGEGFYGLHVHEAALSRGVKVTGATVHFVNEIPDGGPILLQKAVEVLPEDTPETLQRRVMEQAEWILLPQAAELVARQIATSPSNTR